MINYRTTSATKLPCSRLLVQALLCVFSTMLIGSISSNSVANTAVGIALDEQLLAEKLASNQAWQHQRSTLKETPHKLDIQTLSIELDERQKGDYTRRARVYQFNYTLKQSRLVLIDLETAKILKQQIINSVHLPLNSVEIATARSLVEQHPDIMEKLNQNRSQRGLPHLDNLATIDVKASIFEPESQQHICATQRCALVSLFDQTRTVFSVEPLVNLQSLNVSTLQQSL